MSYARKEERFWTDPEVRKLAFPSRFLFDWFFTNPQRHFSGLYYFEEAIIGPQTGIPADLIEKSIKELEDHGFIKLCREHSTVFVREMLKHQTAGKALSPTQKTGIENHIKELHCKCLNQYFIKRYEHLGISINTSINTPTDTGMDTNSQSQSKSQSNSQSINNDPPLVPPEESPSPPPPTAGTPPQGEGDGAAGKTEKKTRKKKADRQLPPYSEEFEQFYKIYPNKRGGKEEAWDIWQRRLKNSKLPPFNYLMECLYKLTQDPEWMREDGRFVPNITSFLNKGRWTDVDAIKATKLFKEPKGFAALRASTERRRENAD